MTDIEVTEGGAGEEAATAGQGGQSGEALPEAAVGVPLESAEAEGREVDEPLDRSELNLTALVEALLFASGEPLPAERICEIARCEAAELEVALAELESRLADERCGYELVRVAEKLQLRTRPQFADFIRELRASRPRRLSNAALETLAIVAYRQPIVKSDIEKIRGVDVTPTLKTLLERSIIRIVGRQASVGNPALYGTTEEFLKLFGLNSLGELPTLRDIRDLENDPGESGEEEAPTEEPVGASADPVPAH